MRILSFDPRIGWSVIDVQDDTFIVYAFGHLNPDKPFNDQYKKDMKVFDKTTVKLCSIAESIEEIMELYQPDYVVCEDNFMQHNRLNAYRALLLWVINLSKLLYEKYDKLLYTIAPKKAKAIFTGDGEADKDMMRECLFTRKDITFREKNKIDELNEHSVDSIGIGVAWYISTRDTL